jgi:hypothetical protein
MTPLTFDTLVSSILLVAARPLTVRAPEDLVAVAAKHTVTWLELCTHTAAAGVAFGFKLVAVCNA